MTLVPLWARGIGRRALLCGAVLSAAIPAGAQESSGTAKPFLMDQFYLGSGNTPPTLAQYCAAPLTYMRSEAANKHFLAGVADELNQPALSQDAFCALVEDGRVRAETPCTGRFYTYGILPDGAITPHARACYDGERLIEVDVDDAGSWKVVASQGCYNSDRVPPPRPEPTGRLVCAVVPQGGVIVPENHDLTLGAVWHPGCNCYRKPQFTPGLHLPNNSTARTGGTYRRCEWVEN